MSSAWHQILFNKLGQFSPENGFIGIDYGNLFLDSQKAKLTYFHELTHLLISGTTEFGQATEKIFQLLRRFKNISDKGKDEIIITLRKNQIFTHEGTATLMQLLMLRNEIGVGATINWAQQNLSEEYYNWVEPLLFVLEMSQKHRTIFTAKIPHLAMHTAIRKRIYEFTLLKNEVDFVNFFDNAENCPDFRFKKLIEVIRNDRFLVLKKSEEICRKANIKFFEDTTKEDVANFLNYLFRLANTKYTTRPEQIKNPEEQSKFILSQANDKIIVGNLNLRLEEDAIFLPTINDILHYKKELEVIFVHFVGDDSKWKTFYEVTLHKKIELSGIIVCRDGCKFYFALSRQEAVSLINNDLKDKTLLVKWGVYNFGQNGILTIDELRTPNIVIYNTIHDLIVKVDKYKGQEKMKCLHFGATEDSPFQGIILKDKLNILHIVNTFGNKAILDYIKRYNIMEMDFCEIESEARHFNNAFSLWLGLDWRVDWFKTILHQKNVFFRLYD